MSTTIFEVQQEIAARLEQERSRKEMLLAGRGRRSCSEQGPHPGSHLWGPRRSRKRTSAPQMGASSGVRTALILRSRRSWPVAPVNSARYINDDIYGQIPLMIAADNGYYQVVELLLKNGAKLDLQNIYYENLSALHYACRSGNLQSVKLLIQYKANLESVSINFQTPIYCATFKDNVQIVENLQINGANVEVKDVFGNTLLHQCAYNNSSKIAEWLLERGTSIDDVNHSNQTPLLLACVKGSEATINVLLKRGANVNFHNIANDTPLHYACNNLMLYRDKVEHCCNIIRSLLLYNADITCKNETNLSPLDLARQNNMETVVTILENHLI